MQVMVVVVLVIAKGTKVSMTDLMNAKLVDIIMIATILLNIPPWQVFPICP